MCVLALRMELLVLDGRFDEIKLEALRYASRPFAVAYDRLEQDTIAGIFNSGRFA